MASLVGVIAGCSSALFLFLLDLCTHRRAGSPWLIFLLPIVGLAMGWVYHRFGESIKGGNSLLIDEIHNPNRTIPFRMAPMILATTLLTHLCGGSAGREGTAVQLSGALSDMLPKPLRLDLEDRKILIMTAIAAGFGSVFGTPLAGAIFGIEVLTVGRIRYEGLLPCLVGSLVGDQVCRILGIQHTLYRGVVAPSLDATLIGWMVLAGVCFGLISFIFVSLTHMVGGLGKDVPHSHLWRPFLGGCVVVGLTLVVGSQIYNGLGIELMSASVHESVPRESFLIKILFTAVTLGCGFKGGEVTPLFCIGATAGNAFGQITHQSPQLFAALGFVSVFAGAANTPLACLAMGIELFGGDLLIPFAICCTLAYSCSGHKGIYPAQRMDSHKAGLSL